MSWLSSASDAWVDSALPHCSSLTLSPSCSRSCSPFSTPASEVEPLPSPLPQQRSFLDVLLHARESALKKEQEHLYNSSSFLCYAVQRNPSTASTPTYGSDASSRCASPYQQLLSDSDESDSEEEKASETDAEEREFGDLSDEYFSECATEERVEDVTDDEVEEGTGIPVDWSEDEEIEDDGPLADDSLSSLLADDTFLASHSSFGDYRLSPGHSPHSVTSLAASWERSFRLRHKPLSNFRLGNAGRLEIRQGRRRHCAPQHLTYFKASTLRLQVASSAACSGRGARRGGEGWAAAAAGEGRMASPYEGTKWVQKLADVQQLDGEEKKPRRDKDKVYKADRARMQRAVHSLAAPNRPAMRHAKSAAHRLVLQERCARKIALAQGHVHRNLPSARPPSSSFPANHKSSARFHRTTARASLTAVRHKVAGKATGGVPEPTSASVLVDKSYSAVRSASFEQFRFNFFHRHRLALERALSDSSYPSMRVTGVRLCPINSHSRRQFMSKLHDESPSELQVPLVYHGTRASNMDSICRRGLLVPNFPVNGVAVANGSSCGVGIYTSTSASYSCSYARDTSRTIFACAAISKGALDRSCHSSTDRAPAVLCDNFVVLMQEARVVPLFLLDFECEERGSCGGPPVGPERSISMTLARALLRCVYAKLQRRWGRMRVNEEL